LRVLRFITVFFCLVGLGLWLLFGQRLSLTEHLLRDRLESIGWVATELVITDISSDTLSISSFRALLPDGPVQEISLSNLVLHFKAKDLLKGSVQSLDLESLHLQLNPQESSHSNPSPLPFVQLRQYIPQDVLVKSVTVTTPDFTQDIRIQLSARNASQEPFTLNIILNAEEIVLQKWLVTNCKGNISLTTEDGEKVTIDENSTFQFDSLTGESTSITDSHISFSALLQRDSTTNSWQLPRSKLHVTTKGVQHQDFSLQPSVVSLEAQVQTLPFQARVTLHNETFILRQNDKNVTLQNLQATLLATDTDIDLQFQFTPAIVPGLIQANINHNLLVDQGTAYFSTAQPLNLQNASDTFQEILQSLNLPLQVTEGIINGKGKIEWEDNQLQQANASFTLRNGAGSYGKTTFNGLIIHQDLQLFPKIKTRSSGYISVSEIKNGITFRKFSLQNQLIARKNIQIPQLLIDSIQMELFGGVISSKKILLDPQQLDLVSTVQLNKIDIHEIIQLSKINGLSVNGILDGAITLHVKKGTVTIPTGELHSRIPGGTISYFPPGGAGNYSTLPAYALKALEEFNYSLLTATPTYYEDGTLNIAIHTEGHSPQLNTERPVHLNLNTEQNILSLLESLRYSNKITDELEQKLQNQPLSKEAH